jgi:MFS family permease
VDQLLPAEPIDAASAAGFFPWMSPARWLMEKKLNRGFWIFFAIAFFFDFGFAIYFFLFNLFLVDLHFTERTIGLVGGAFTLGSVAGTLPAGWISRKTGLRPLLLVCLITAPLMGITRVLVLSEPLQIGLGFLAGLAMCLWAVCFLPLLARLTTEENRASAFGLIFSVSIGTSALGGFISGYLPDWLRMAGHAMQAADVKRFILIGSCGIALLGLIPTLMLQLPAARSASSDGETQSPKVWKVHPFLWRFLPSMALWTAVLAAFTPFANVFLSRDLHIPLSKIGLIFSAAQGIQLCVGLLTPWVFKRLGLVNGIVATQVATAAAMGCLAATQNRGLAVALYLGFSATQWMSSPGLYNLLMSKIPDHERSTAAAMTMFCNALLQSCATAGAGILFTQFGYPPVLFGISAMALAAAGLFASTVGPADRRMAAQP